MNATLCFLPGTLCDERVWRDVAGRLGRHYHCQFINYQRDSSIAAMALRALSGTTGMLIPIGHSMGGMVALDMWRQAPTRIAAIALLGVVGDADTAEKSAKRDSIIARLASAVSEKQRDDLFRTVIESELVPSYFADTSCMEIADRARLAAQAAAQDAAQVMMTEMALSAGPATYIAQAAALKTRRAAWQVMSSVHVPCLVVRGQRDSLCDAEQHNKICAQLAAVTSKVIPDIAHFTPLEAPAAVAQLLCNWLEMLSRNAAEEGIAPLKLPGRHDDPAQPC